MTGRKTGAPKDASMRVLVATLGSIGDLMPFLAAAEALRARGHEVIIASHAGYAPLVQRAGFGFAIIWNAMPQPLDDLLEQAPQQAWARVVRDLFAPAAGPTASFIRHAALPGNCAVLASWSAFGALEAAQLNLPLFRACLSPHAVGEAMSAPGHPSQTWLGFFPDWFAPPKPDWPDIRRTGFPAMDESLVPALDPSLEAFLSDGPAPIVFTPGSYQHRCAHFFAESLKACKRLGARAIFLTPHAGQIPPDLPDGVMHLKYAPLQRLAARASALVHHGGIGTLAQGLRSAVPQLAVPQFFDQPDNARHLVALGAGQALPAPDYDAVRALPILDALVHDDAVRQRCRQIASRFQQHDPMQIICDQIEAAAR